MRKDEFLRQLEYLLQDIPEADREEAIHYYRDYLEEAGPENEAEVLREFGSAERIASIIRSDQIGNLEDGGSFTERGFEDERFREPNYQLAKTVEQTENHTRVEHDGADQKSEWKKHQGFESVQKEKKQEPQMSGCLKVVLGLCLLLAASPIILGLGGSLLGSLMGSVVILAVLLLLAAVLTIACLLSGVVLIGAGVAALWSDPVDGVLAIGGGLLIFGIGLLALVFSVWFYGTLVPRIFRWIGKGIDTVSDWVRRRGK